MLALGILGGFLIGVVVGALVMGACQLSGQISRDEEGRGL